MATTRRDSPLSLGLGKDKKPMTKSLTRSSSAAPASGPSTKRSLKPSISIATTDHKAHPVNKNVTNYHRPALVSRAETSASTSTSAPTSTRFLRKPGPATPDQSPATSNKALNRRRSFDKPLNSASRVQQHALVSPGPKDRNPTTSLSSVRTISNKAPAKPATRSPAGARADRAITKSGSGAGALNSQRARTMRRSLTSPSPAPARKGAANKRSSPLKKATRPVEAESEDDGPFMLGADDEVEEIASIGSDADLVPFDHIEKTDFIYSASASTDSECDQSKNKTNDIAPLSPLRTWNAKEIDNFKAHEDVKEQDDAKIGETGEVIVKEMVESEDKMLELKASGDNEEEKQGEDGKLAPVVAPAPVPEIAKQHQSAGKKDSPVYNDVIKETASKLLEKRKNKVSALVGAFETVISLQD